MAACISARPTVWRSARRPPTHAPSASLSFSRQAKNVQQQAHVATRVVVSAFGGSARRSTTTASARSTPPPFHQWFGSHASTSERHSPLPPRAAAADPPTSDGDGGAPPPPPPPAKKTEDQGDGDDDEREAARKALDEGGVSVATLPTDMQTALAQGRLTAADARAWVGISQNALLCKLATAMPSVRDKLVGNPRLLITIAIELIIGCSSKLVAEVAARGEKFKSELDFVTSNMMLEIVADFSLVWLLSPSRMLGPMPTGKLARAIAMLPGHATQKGDFKLWQRFATYGYRGAQFFCVGIVSTLLGHGSTMALVSLKPKTADSKELSPLVKTSLVWASFMVASSNLRYQTVNCIEERVLDTVFTGAPRNLATLVLRFANCFSGSLQWVWFARATGLQ